MILKGFQGSSEMQIGYEAGRVGIGDQSDKGWEPKKRLRKRLPINLPY